MLQNIFMYCTHNCADLRTMRSVPNRLYEEKIGQYRLITFTNGQSPAKSMTYSHQVLSIDHRVSHNRLVRRTLPLAKLSL